MLLGTWGSPELLKRKYFKNVTTLLSGTAVAQGIVLLLAPVLTRQYSPEEFGVFAYFIAVSEIIAVVATFRYSYAIIIPKKTDTAVSILWLCTLLSLATSTIVLIFVYLLNISGFTVPFLAIIQQYLYFIPLLVFCGAMYISLYAWHNRNRRYKTIVVARIVNAGGAAVIAVVLGLFHVGVIGLITGLILSRIIAAFYLFIQALQLDLMVIKSVNKKTVFNAINTYKRFPIFSVPADMVNMLSRQIPVLMLRPLFGPVAIGFYDLCQKVLGSPLSLVGTAVQDVFKIDSAQEYSLKGSCKGTYRLTFLLLTFVASIIFIPIYFLAPQLFPIIFGPEWADAGIYAQILVPFFAIRFVSSPLSYVFYIAGKQHADLIWQVTLLVFLYLIFSSEGSQSDAFALMKKFSFISAVMYLVYLLMSANYSRGRSNKNVSDS